MSLAGSAAEAASPPEIIHLISSHVCLSHQSHPASLKLLIKAEGRQLLLDLQKNE